MEIVVIIIMLLVGFSFVLKLTCQRPAARIAVSAVAAVFVLLACDSASSQSKTQIADWLEQPALMLDVAVLLTVDVAFQICFCVLAAKAIAGVVSPARRLAIAVCRYVPGLLIFPVLFAMLTALIFALPGVEFSRIAQAAALGLLVVAPLLAAGLKWLVPEPDIRLEVIFMVNLLIAALGVVATVNGRTAVVGTNSVEWGALAGVAAILACGFVAGIFINRLFIRKKLSKIK